MFNTGDIVRWREDGSLDTFGRGDDQVKIKGFRVELDGVTAVIEKFPGITRARACMLDGNLHGFYSTTTLIDEHDLDAFVRLQTEHDHVRLAQPGRQGLANIVNGTVFRPRRSNNGVEVLQPSTGRGVSATAAEPPGGLPMRQGGRHTPWPLAGRPWACRQA